METKIHKTLHEEVFHHNFTDPHRRGAGLSDFILGAQDGLVNVLGVALGIAAATNDARVVLVAGLATTFAESISMGAVAFTTTLADADLYQSEREREYRHIVEAGVGAGQERAGRVRARGGHGARERGGDDEAGGARGTRAHLRLRVVGHP